MGFDLATSPAAHGMRCSGGANGERYRQDLVLPGVSIPLGDRAQELVSRKSAEPGDGNAYGRERRRQIPGDRDVVEPRDRDIVGNRPSARAQGAQHPDGGRVVGSEYRRRVGAPFQKLESRALATRLRKIPHHFPLGQPFNVVLAQRCPVPAQPLLRVAVAARPANEGDPTMAECQEMTHHRVGAAEVVDIDRVVRPSLDPAVQQDDRQMRREIDFQRSGVEVRRHHDQTIHSTAHGAESGTDLFSVVVGARDQQVVLEAPCFGVHATDDFGEELTVEIGKKPPNRHRSTRDQGASCAVGNVAQGLRRCEHALTRLFPDWAVAVERPGNGSHRNARLAGYVLDRCAQTTPPRVSGRWKRFHIYRIVSAGGMSIPGWEPS